MSCSLAQYFTVGYPGFAQSDVVIGDLLQFILHVYMVTSLRVSNQGLLDNVRQWVFGQILAPIVAGSTVVECAKSLEGE